MQTDWAGFHFIRQFTIFSTWRNGLPNSNDMDLSIFNNEYLGHLKSKEIIKNLQCCAKWLTIKNVSAGWFGKHVNRVCLLQLI